MSVLFGGVALADAPCLGGVGTVHLVAFVVTLFPEHREKHNAPPLNEVVGDAPRHCAEVESKFVKSVAQRPGVRFTLCWRLDG